MLDYFSVFLNKTRLLFIDNGNRGDRETAGISPDIIVRDDLSSRGIMYH